MSRIGLLDKYTDVSAHPLRADRLCAPDTEQAQGNAGSSPDMNSFKSGGIIMSKVTQACVAMVAFAPFTAVAEEPRQAPLGTAAKIQQTDKYEVY
jgi:hypothetical protein